MKTGNPARNHRAPPNNNPKPPLETRLTVEEMQNRVHVLLGKESENRLDQSIRHKERLYEQWKQKMLKTRKPIDPP